MLVLDREEFLMCQDSWLMELNTTPEAWADYEQRQDNYRQNLKLEPLYVVSTSSKGKARYCGGAEFGSYAAAIAFIENNPTKLGIQGVSCLLP